MTVRSSSQPVHRAHRLPRGAERGFALLLVVFFAAVMLIAMAAAAPRVVIQGRREMEEEMVWRGEQYVRAVRLYYRKYGRFPKSVEDFSKNPGNLHFLRKPYNDPMNHSDGAWRYIYVSASGQLIGSVTRKNPLGAVALPGQPGSPFGPAGQGVAQGGTQGRPAPGFQPPPPTAPLLSDVQPGSGAEGAAQVSGLPPQPLPPPPDAPNKAIEGASTSEGKVFGGSLVGIGSKVDHRSLRFYRGYGKYREWEFIWDPAEDLGLPGGPPGTGIPPIGGPPPGGNPPQ
jgi:hypothetical protein